MGSANPPDGTQQSVLVLSKDALLHMCWCWLGCAERGALNLHLNRNPLGLTVNALVSWRNLIPPALSTYVTIDFFTVALLAEFRILLPWQS